MKSRGGEGRRGGFVITRQRRAGCATSDRIRRSRSVRGAVRPRPRVPRPAAGTPCGVHRQGEAGDLPQLLVDRAADHENSRRVRRAQPGTPDALWAVFRDGAGLHAVMAQEQEYLSLLLRAVGVEPLDAL